jgi:hypothetical protein
MDLTRSLADLVLDIDWLPAVGVHIVLKNSIYSYAVNWLWCVQRLAVYF